VTDLAAPKAEEAAPAQVEHAEAHGTDEAANAKETAPKVEAEAEKSEEAALEEPKEEAGEKRARDAPVTEPADEAAKAPDAPEDGTKETPKVDGESPSKKAKEAE
jgi:hypothetical protein